jgi:hypothetical protein
MDVDQHGPEMRHGGVRHPGLVSSLGWGALWAPLLGVWGVFPHFLRTQRVHPASADECYSRSHSPRDGIFVAAGPSIAHQKESVPISYCDVVPSVLELMGLAPLPDMPRASIFRTVTDEVSIGHDPVSRASNGG